jgi:hypothetical protein
MRSVADSPAKWAIIPPLFAILCLGLCQCALPSRLVVSESTEPFHIKTNETLGIRLGMSLADYKHQRKHYDDECAKEDADAAVNCFVNVGLDKSANHSKPALTVVGVEVDFYYLTFYEGKLIDVEYWLSPLSLDLNPLKLALQEKFGTPRTIRSDIIDWQDWKNSVSSLSLHGSAHGGSVTILAMRLDKEYDDWRARLHKRENDQAKKGI